MRHVTQALMYAYVSLPQFKSTDHFPNGVTSHPKLNALFHTYRVATRAKDGP